MNCKIPFTKDILFEKKVSEITSISLEHEISATDEALKGNFIISGDFKSHEISVNKEPFSYILPFEIEITKDIDKDTIEFMIDDFTYEIVDNSILRVKIEFNVIASLLEKEEEEREENVFQEVGDMFEEKIIDNFEFEPIEPLKKEEITKEEERMDNIKKEEEKMNVVSEDTIIDSINSTKNDFATYHIHMVSDGESIETICTMYNSNMNILADYNDLSNISSGDKLIIPENNE